MNFIPSPFLMIKNGTKTIELRLYDEKRRKISQGDTIRFHNSADAGETILTKVTGLYVFETFDEPYENLPLLECGYTEENIRSASSRDMNKYYSLEMQSQYGVIGIRVVAI